jgi:hypothetical protein
MSKRSIVLLPCMVSSPFVRMMTVLRNEWVQMARHQGPCILVLGHVTGTGASQRTDHPHDNWSNSHNCSHTCDSLEFSNMVRTIIVECAWHIH